MRRVSIQFWKIVLLYKSPSPANLELLVLTRNSQRGS
jgi:hypothetical protein